MGHKQIKNIQKTITDSILGFAEELKRLVD